MNRLIYLRQPPATPDGAVLVLKCASLYFISFPASPSLVAGGSLNRLMRYNWQQDDWPNFTYDLSEVVGVLSQIHLLEGMVSGLIEGIPDGLEADAILDLLIAEAIETSDIEGEFLTRDEVKSSIKNNLGLNVIHEQ